MGNTGGKSDNFWDEAADIGTNFLTLGYAGYQDGGFRTGYVGTGLKKGYDGLSGRTRAKEDERKANDAITAEEAHRADLARQQLVRREAADRQASGAAEALRTSSPSANASSFSRPSYRLNPDQDFLGL